jgi:DNA-binding transcriptional regulator YiaG
MTGGHVKEHRGTLGDKIRGFRERLDWTRTKLAAELGITEQTVKRWEEGRTEPGAGSLNKLVQLAQKNGKRFYPFDGQKKAERPLEA